MKDLCICLDALCSKLIVLASKGEVTDYMVAPGLGATSEGKWTLTEKAPLLGHNFAISQAPLFSASPGLRGGWCLQVDMLQVRV